MTSARIYTAKDLEELPDDGNRYDLIKGELICMAPAGGEHGLVAHEIGRQLGNFIFDRELGRVFGAETGFKLSTDPEVILAPDAAFIRTARLPAREAMRGFMPIAPDLVVEVVSPHDRYSDVRLKIDTYLEYGVRLVWVLEPRRRTVTIHRPNGTTTVLAGKDALDGEDVLPGFQVSVAALFD